jgi:chorismate mutase/prephenate dehydrogenase
MGEVDRSLLELLAQRQELAQQIGQVKREAGLPIRDYRQEREVVQRARQAATQVGLPALAGEELALLCIKSSLTVQEQAQVAAERPGGGRRALVIGGAGRMGRWMSRFLSAQGWSVTVADPACSPGPAPTSDAAPPLAQVTDWRPLQLDHDLIVLASPLGVTSDILHELARRPPSGVVFDVGSLKGPVQDGLWALSRAGARVTSIHPMFGPDTELLSGRHVIFCDVGCAEATTQARELFSSTMATLVEMDLESHDRLIAYVLGLSHALNIAFFTALADSGEAAPRLAQLSSTTFDAQLSIARRVAAENPQLYFEIQRLNAYGTESLSALLYAVERVRSLVRAGDLEGFRKLMERGKSYLETRTAPPPP